MKDCPKQHISCFAAFSYRTSADGMEFCLGHGTALASTGRMQIAAYVLFKNIRHWTMINCRKSRSHVQHISLWCWTSDTIPSSDMKISLWTKTQQCPFYMNPAAIAGALFEMTDNSYSVDVADYPFPRMHRVFGIHELLLQALHPSSTEYRCSNKASRRGMPLKRPHACQGG